MFRAYLAAIINALIIGMSFIFVKIALTAASPIDILAHRFTFSFLAALLPLSLGWMRINRGIKEMLPIFPLALLYPAMFFAFQAFGLVYTTSSEAGIIQATIPIFTLILARYFLKEYSTLWQKLSILLSVVGVVYIFAMRGTQLGSANLGTILILLSALSSAGYSVLARKLNRSFSVMEMTFLMTTIGFVFFNGLSIVMHIAAGTLSQYFVPFQHPSFVMSMLYLGVLSSLVTSFMSNYALSKIEASKMSAINNLSVIITMFGGVLFLGEQLASFHLIGAVLILAGVLGANLLSAKNKQKSPISVPK